MATRDDIYQAIRNADAAGDTASVQKLAAYLQTMEAPVEAPKPTSFIEDMKADIAGIPGRAGNILAGGLRGAGSIGATLIAPYDVARDALNGKGLSLESNRQRRADMDASLRDFGANTDSVQYKAGKLGAEVAGSMGVGGALANGARAAGAAPSLVSALSSGGLSGGGNMLTRTLAGAVSGGATAGLVDPESAKTGAVVGGIMPGAVRAAGEFGDVLSRRMEAGSRRLMQSAIKPTIAQRQSGEADTAIDTLLQYGINPTRGGVQRIRSLVDDLNAEIASQINNSTATVGKQDVLNRVGQVRGRFANQVSPTKDLNAIQGVADDFATHPQFPTPQTQIPVQEAQRMKQGTYRILRDKFGEEGSAATEAQKALARGLKEEIATAVPGVGALNAEESRLLATLNVAERRALLEANKNVMGLATLAQNPLSWAAFMADRSSAFKALAARMVNRAAPGAGAQATGQALLENNALMRALTGPATSENRP